VTPDTGDSDSTKEKETTAVPSTTGTELTETEGVDLADSAELGDEPKVDELQADESEAAAVESAKKPAKPGISWSRVLAYGVLPTLALILALGAGFLKWQESSVREANQARIESVAAAKDSTIRLLSYKPDTVEKDLTSARDLLTGDFRDSYTQLTNDVVIPGSKEKQISAVASVPAVASVSADPKHAVVLVFVNQSVIVGADAPTSTASSVQVTLDKVGDRWLISKFDPV
jgi:Mce-associated membrane protein